MKLLELLGFKIKELTEILKDEDVKGLMIKDDNYGIRVFNINFVLYGTRKVEISIRLQYAENYRAYDRNLMDIENEFNNHFKELREYIKSVKNGELKSLKEEIEKKERELKELRIRYNEMNNYGKKLD